MILLRYLVIAFAIVNLSISIKKAAVKHEILKKLFCKHQNILKEINYKYNAAVFHTIAIDIDYKLTPKAIQLYFKRHFCKINNPNLDEFQSLSNEGAEIQTNCHLDFTTGSKIKDIILPLSFSKTSDQTIISSDIKGTQLLMKQDNDTVQSENSISPVYSTTDEKYNETYTIGNKNRNIKNIQTAIYKFPIDIYESTNLQPRSKIYKRTDGAQPYKKRKVLPKFQWSHLLREKIWQYCRTLCTITFSYSFRSGTIYFRGKCTQCFALYNIESEICTNQIYNLKCTIFNYDKNFKHKKDKRVRMTPHLANIYAKKLENRHACVVRTETANEKMESNEIEPPIIPSLGALRQLKHCVRKERWLDDDVLLSLVKMAKGPYRSVIRYVSIIPNIDIYYYTEDQSNYYKQYCSKYSEEVTISVNATGSMFRPVILKTGELVSKRLFLYTVLVTANQNLLSVPISQKISDCHTSTSIRDWLSNFFDYVNPNKPLEVITDDSSALILAAVRVFTHFETTKEYLMAAFAILFGKSNAQMPKVYLRLDTSHFFKTINNLSCWADVDEKIKEFYMKCLTFIKKSEDFNTVRLILQNMLILISNKYDDANESSEYNCEEAERNILEITKTLKTDCEFNKYQYTKNNNDSRKNIDDPDDQDLKETNLLQWFDDMVTSTKNRKDTTTPKVNSLYFPRFMPTLRRLMVKLPMWSNIMMPFFKSKNRAPSSSANENYFKTLKNYVAKTKLHKCRIDEFIQIHSEYLGGQLKLALSNLITTCTIIKNEPQKKKKRKVRSLKTIKKKVTSKAKNSKTVQNIKKLITLKKESSSKLFFAEDSVFSDVPTYIENWKGEGQENAKSESPHPISFMKNGSNSEALCLINTCAFDSACHLIAFAYYKSPELKSTFHQNKSLLSDLIIGLVNGANMELLNSFRERICLTYFHLTSPLPVGLELNCESSVTHIYENIFLHYGIFSSYFNKRCLNEECGVQIGRHMPFISLDIQTLSLFGITALEESITLETIAQKSTSTCALCKSNAEIWYDLQNHLSFEIIGTEQSTISAKLADMPKTLLMKGNVYELIGVIEFVKPLQGLSMGHYKSHVYKGDSQWVCYDDLNPLIKISAKTNIDISIVTYIII